MPANLPPQYHEAEARFRDAKTAEEKIAALEEMLRIMPKHKGTSKLQADVKARIAKFRKQPKKKGPTRAGGPVIPREGAGQVVLVGPPNSGKSSLVDRLTHATPEVADYPYTTREPIPGMMPFEDIGIQLIDMPPLWEQHIEPWYFDLVRRADLIWIVVDEASSLEGIEDCLALLEPKRIGLVPAGTPRSQERPIGWVDRRALLLITGHDRPESAENLEALRELLEVPWPVVPVSAVNGEGLEDLKRRTFEALQIMRVYSKQPGKPADREAPFTLPRESTVGDLARQIHKDISAAFKFARIWGASAFDGQTVQRDHILAEGDIVEIHT